MPRLQQVHVIQITEILACQELQSQTTTTTATRAKEESTQTTSA
jgi:hypothetical protein